MLKINNSTFPTTPNSHTHICGIDRLHQNRRKFCQSSGHKGFYPGLRYHLRSARNHRIVTMVTASWVKLLHL